MNLRKISNTVMVHSKTLNQEMEDIRSKRMMKNGEWCDTIMIKAIASMWSIRISVIYANNFTQVKFRHNVAACQADIVLLYNGHYVNGHYIGTVHAAGDNFLIG